MGSLRFMGADEGVRRYTSLRFEQTAPYGVILITDSA
jgi:hypothetical protein